MFYIPVILGSIRRNRESAKVAEFAVSCLRKLEGTSTELLDLKEFNLPIMEERLRFRDDAPASALELSARINRADSIVIVTPEYSSGYPGVLKNALDYLKPECRRKPFGIITVSSAEGGMLCLISLRQVILHMGGVPIPSMLPVFRVQESFDAEGKPPAVDFQRRAKEFFNELLWFTEGLATHRANTARAAAQARI